jgi:hypothetical protein
MSKAKIGNMYSCLHNVHVKARSGRCLGHIGLATTYLLPDNFRNRTHISITYNPYIYVGCSVNIMVSRAKACIGVQNSALLIQIPYGCVSTLVSLSYHLIYVMNLRLFQGHLHLLPSIFKVVKRARERESEGAREL